MEKQYDIDDEIEIDLKDLLMELLAYWKIIVVVTILAGAIGFAISNFLMVPMYESTAELYVQVNKNQITLTDIQTSSSLTNDYIVLVKDRPIIEQVIKNLDLKENYRSLYNKVTVSNPSNSRFLRITVTDENANRAKAIADNLAEVTATQIVLKMGQEKPEIVHEGYADEPPVSPHILKNTVIGALLGGVLVSLIIVLTYLFNDTIMGPEDIEKKLGMNVLGTLPLEEAEDDGEKAGKSHRRRKSKKSQGGE